MTYQKKKKNLFYFLCAQKDKIKEPNRTEAMRKSQEWLQQPGMDMTLHLALAPSPPQSHVWLSLESISRAAYSWICRQFCNCHCLIPPSCFASLPPSWAQPSSTLVFVGSLRSPHSVSAKEGSYDSCFFSLFLRDKRVGFFQQFSKPEIPLGKCLCAYVITHSRGERGAGVFVFLLLFNILTFML